ncbi:hypothetical protein PBY51_005583 [Eleginops maclovinus]|uniref:Uncharacterized protein n=1 Tax=Eleginops maclovinus TaxID=56733 RepID=A0AAN7X4P8_ELEMC|nr:hypothetical protein PBY51_005583 [Eleginops maclovinus]
MHPEVVNQWLELHRAAVLQNPGVCGLAPFKACIGTNRPCQPSSLPPHINNLLFELPNPPKNLKGSTVCWPAPKTNSPRSE